MVPSLGPLLFFLCASAPLRERCSPDEPGAETYSDDAAVLRGEAKEMFAGVSRFVHRCSLEGNVHFCVRAGLPKNANLYPDGYNKVGIKIRWYP